MKRLIMLAGFVGVLALAGAPRVWAQAACATDTLADYIALGSTGCTIDGKTFSNFSYNTAPAGAQPSAANITVIPVMNAAGEGFTFEATWLLNNTSGSFASLDSLIGLQVNTNNGAATIEDASVATLSGALITGDGMLTITEGLCLGGTSPPCPGGFQTVAVAGTASTVPLPSEVMFTPTGILEASKDIGLTSAANGFVDVTSITDQFSQVPEPASMGLLGTALFGAYGLLRRRIRPS